MRSLYRAARDAGHEMRSEITEERREEMSEAPDARVEAVSVPRRGCTVDQVAEIFGGSIIWIENE